MRRGCLLIFEADESGEASESGEATEVPTRPCRTGGHRGSEALSLSEATEVPEALSLSRPPRVTR